MGEKRYQCSKCEKAFASPAPLSVHMRYHTGEKPFECDVCLQHFSTLGNLKVHKGIHTGERPYMCEVCGKRSIKVVRSLLVSGGTK